MLGTSETIRQDLPRSHRAVIPPHRDTNAATGFDAERPGKTSSVIESAKRLVFARMGVVQTRLHRVIPIAENICRQWSSVPVRGAASGSLEASASIAASDHNFGDGGALSAVSYLLRILCPSARDLARTVHEYVPGHSQLGFWLPASDLDMKAVLQTVENCS
jgi:hypothetical protein